MKNASILLVLVLLALLLYLPLTEAEFTNWDDPAQIYQNPLVIGFNLGQLGEIFSRSVVSEYHPVITIIYGLEARIFGPSPFFFHLSSIVWHLLNICLLFVFLQRIGLNHPLPWAVGGALFALHPFQVAALGWVSARKDLVCTTFYLLALLAYRPNSENYSKSRMALIFTFMAIAILAKAIAVTIPAALLGLDLVAGRKDWAKILRGKVPFFLIGLAFAFLAFSLQPVKPGREAFSLNSLFPAGRAICFYAEKFLFPVNLSTLYPEAPGEYVASPYNLLRVGLALSIFMGLSAFFWRHRHCRTAKLAAFGVALTLINLAPVLRIIPFGGEEIMASRFMYLPLIGLALTLGAFLDRYPPGIYPRALLGLVGVGMIIANLNYQEYWMGSEEFWGRVLFFRPKYAIGHHQLGDAYWREGRGGASLACCSRALELDPGLVKAWEGKSVGLWARGEKEQSIQLLEEGIEVMIQKENKEGIARLSARKRELIKLLEINKIDKGKKDNNLLPN